MSISRCIFSSSRNVRGRAIAPNATKGLDSREIAKAARNLLLHFDHAHISLGQIIVKGDRQVVQEGQQVTCSSLFASSFGPRRWTQLTWLSGLSLKQHRLLLCLQGGDCPRVQRW